jgi:amino acid permease
MYQPAKQTLREKIYLWLILFVLFLVASLIFNWAMEGLDNIYMEYRRTFAPVLIVIPIAIFNLGLKLLSVALARAKEARADKGIVQAVTILFWGALFSLILFCSAYLLLENLFSRILLGY